MNFSGSTATLLTLAIVAKTYLARLNYFDAIRNGGVSGIFKTKAMAAAVIAKFAY
jgi:hypothetical protein